jgi:hypothetical protein
MISVPVAPAGPLQANLDACANRNTARSSVNVAMVALGFVPQETD